MRADNDPKNGNGPNGPDEPLEELLASWSLALRAKNRAVRTVRNYCSAAELLDEFLPADRGILSAQRPDIERFIADQLDRHSTSTAATRFRCVQQFYRWATDEELLEVSPMEGMTPPKLDEKVIPVLTLDEMRALVTVCDGKTFEDRRDAALIRFMLDTGSRLGEVHGLTITDIEAKEQTALVTGKGDRQRRVYFSATTAVALDRYMRERRRHPWGANPAVWIGPKGPLTDSGISQVIKRRGRLAGIDGLHPHQLRHTWAHLMKVGGMADEEVMALGGWRTGQMLAKYGSSARSERARDTYQRMAPGDQL